METNVNYTVVGAFVILMTASIVLAIIWLSSGFSLDQYKVYQIYMQESVSGLGLDSPVEFNGVNVGTVKSVELDNKNPQLVHVLLNIKSATPITQGTFATLTTRGVTGFTFISLKDKSTDLRPLLVLPGEQYPVIKTAPSLFLRLDIALNRLTKNIQTVAEAIQGLLDKDNQQSIKTTLKNLAHITDTLSNNSAKMDTILTNTARASQQIGPFLQSTAGAMRTLEVQTLPNAYELLSNLNAMTRNLSAVTNDLKQNPSVLIRGTAPGTPGPGERQ